MVERDKPLDIDDLPSLQAEKRDVVSPQKNKADKKPTAAKSERVSKTNTLTFALLILTVLLFIGLSFAAYFLYQQQQSLVAAEVRIAALEGRLSTTDESLSQSSVALQVRLQEVKERTDELWTQMDKLWASAWRRNQTELAEQSTKIDGALKDLKALKLQFNEQDKLTQGLRKEASQQTASIEKITGRMNVLASSQKALEQQQKNQNDLKGQFSVLQARQDKLQSQVEDNQAWIESNNAFRQQTNQSISRIDRQLKALSNPAP